MEGNTDREREMESEEMGTVAGKYKRERIDNVNINFIEANLISHPSTLIIILRENTKG